MRELILEIGRQQGNVLLELLAETLQEMTENPGGGWDLVIGEGTGHYSDEDKAGIEDIMGKICVEMRGE